MGHLSLQVPDNGVYGFGIDKLSTGLGGVYEYSARAPQGYPYQAEGNCNQAAGNCGHRRTSPEITGTYRCVTSSWFWLWALHQVFPGTVEKLGSVKRS